MLVERKKSLAKILTYSQELKEMYTTNRKNCDEFIALPASIRDFAFAPQRYSSMCKTFLRMVLTINAALVSAVQVIHMRGHASIEGKACIELMQNVDVEFLVQASPKINMLINAQSCMYR